MDDVIEMGDQAKCIVRLMLVCNTKLCAALASLALAFGEGGFSVIRCYFDLFAQGGHTAD